MTDKGTRRAPDLHLLSAEESNEALATNSRIKIVKKVEGKSSQSLPFSSEFLCVKSHAQSLLTTKKNHQRLFMQRNVNA